MWSKVVNVSIVVKAVKVVNVAKVVNGGLVNVIKSGQCFHSGQKVKVGQCGKSGQWWFGQCGQKWLMFP